MTGQIAPCLDGTAAECVRAPPNAALSGKFCRKPSRNQGIPFKTAIGLGIANKNRGGVYMNLLPKMTRSILTATVVSCLWPGAWAQDRDRDRDYRDHDRVTRLEPGLVIPIRVLESIDALALRKVISPYRKRQQEARNRGEILCGDHHRNCDSFCHPDSAAYMGNAGGHLYPRRLD